MKDSRRGNNSQPRTNTSRPNGNQKNQKKQKLSRRQFFFVIIQTQIGVGILSLPYDLHKAAGKDGWISLIGAGLVIAVLLILIWLLAKRFPDKHLFDYIGILLGKFLGKCVSLMYSVYFIFVASLVLILYVRMINIWILPLTPRSVLIVLMILAGLYIASSSITVLARVYTILSVLLVFLIIGFSYVLREIQLIYLFPIGTEGIMKILQGMNAGAISFLGFVVILLVYPVVKGTDKEKLWTIMTAHGFVLFFYLFTVFISFTFFGSEELKLVPAPLLYMLKAFEFTVVSRIDLFFLSIWIVSVTTSFTSYLYMSGIGFSSLFNAKRQLPALIVSAFLILFVTFLPGNEEESIIKFSTWISRGGYLFSGILPIFILIIAWVRKKKEQGSESSC
ncbi:GerAB/ArcD/ProY family transporter [Thalassobacillus pellis]|uniref:GerAB/ArcD/ProY family transporter n=1 Tax=Thalassobacillus pellis TaxID=748008 RepID=UPI00195FFC0E|nr:endospore germination permease [Thalassobacillus pellis]MBM7551213.1 spore germination protein (amino acid permease) [Thalassobacillus pellis]